MDPRVSVVIPVFNGARHVARAIRSALGQTIRSIEVLVADNCSTDDTWSVLQGLAAADDRVRPVRADAARGADVARNACLDVARGEWVAVLDADDVMHPARLEVLLEFARRRQAAVVADNLRLFAADGRILGLAWPPRRAPDAMDAADFIRANVHCRSGLTIGYVKPLFRRRLIEESGLRYPRMRIGEDFLFVFSLLRGGERLHLHPQGLYGYAQMQGSLSRKLAPADIQALRKAATAHIAACADDSNLVDALKAYRQSLELALEHWAFVDAVKRWRLGEALAVPLRHPAVWAPILRFGRESVAKRLARLGRGRQAGPPSAAKPEVVGYFGQDCTDSAVIRRVTALQAAGMAVLGFTFRRRKFNRDYVPTWDDVALGETRDRDYLGRLVKLVKAVGIIAAHRRRLRAARILYARNIDMALLAWFAKIVSRSRGRLVYEVLDVQRAFLGAGARARLLRWVERRILARAALLVVSSPAFIDRYFVPMQGFVGNWSLLENKVLATPAVLAAPAAPRAPDGRLAIGWFGTLRCVRSLEILARIAEALPQTVRVDLRGFPTETGLEPFLRVVERHPAMTYGGEFFSPSDLPRLYGAIDLAWCFDFLDAGGNSDWLLPNRLYDCGLFNVPALAASDTETGRRVADLGMGWTFAEPLAESLIDFLRTLTPEALAARRARMAALPPRLFREEGDTARLMRAVLGGGADWSDG